VDSFEKKYPETKTGQGDKETGREGDEETLRTAKDKGERIKDPCSCFVGELSRFDNSQNVEMTHQKSGPRNCPGRLK